MDVPSLGGYVAGLRVPRDQVRDRAAFLARTATKESAPELAAVQDWSVGTFVVLRPGYERKEALLSALADALR